MKKKTVFMGTLFILGITFVSLFYGVYLPGYLEDTIPEQKEKIELASGLKAIEQVEVNGFTHSATWKVEFIDSLGNTSEKLINVTLDRGNWIIQPYKAD